MTPVRGAPSIASGLAGAEGLERTLALAFAPLDKRAFGLAVGTAAGLLVALVTVVHVIGQPAEALNIGLLGQYFYGYTVSWPGAFIGGAWGFFSGFVGGWFVAFCRNLMLGVMLFIGRTRSELDATRDFLDHI
jgi:hypothetical protein